MRIFLLVGLIAISNCVQFSLLQRCACSEYGQTLCDAFPYCAWSGTACVDMDCKYLTTADTCTGEKSSYQCQWNTSTSKCETHTYTCAEVTEKDCAEKIFGFDCMWANDKCVNFSCASASKDNCSPFTCAMSDSNDSCKDPASVDCSSFTTKATCDQTDGNGNMCHINDNNVCSQYEIFTDNCSNYSDVKDFCVTMCTYVDSTKTCQPKSCADYTTQDECSIQLDLPGLKVIPCTWNSTACLESTPADLEKLDVFSCMISTMMNYKWSMDNGKCTACTQLSSNPQFKYLQDYLNNQSYGIQIIGMIVGLSLILN